MKLRFVILPILAAAGMVAAAYTVHKQNAPPPSPPPVVPPVASPFSNRVSGSGVVEPSSEIIAIGSAISGPVESVAVKEAQRVKQGDALFTIDTRELKAKLAAAKAREQVASMKLKQLDSMPHPEKVREAEAIVEQRQWSLDDAQKRLDRLTAIGEDTALSRNERPTREFEVANAKAKLLEAQAALDTIRRGTYPEDRAVAEADVAVAGAEVGQLQTDLERSTVRAPIDGTVLRVHVRPGEFAMAGPSGEGMVVLGTLEPLNIRVDIDELDAWRFDPKGHAVAALRGGKRQEFPITLVRMVPLVMPKKTLTGENAERIDTRVMQIIYQFEDAHAAVLPGQLLDVYIETGDAPAGKK